MNALRDEQRVSVIRKEWEPRAPIPFASQSPVVIQRPFSDPNTTFGNQIPHRGIAPHGNPCGTKPLWIRLIIGEKARVVISRQACTTGDEISPSCRWINPPLHSFVLCIEPDSRVVSIQIGVARVVGGLHLDLVLSSKLRNELHEGSIRRFSGTSFSGCGKSEIIPVTLIPVFLIGDIPDGLISGYQVIALTGIDGCIVWMDWRVGCCECGRGGKGCS